MKQNFQSLKTDVVDTHLCVRCGTCEGVCPEDAIQMNDIIGQCKPELIETCIDCGLCYQTCPGHSMDFGSLKHSVSSAGFDLLGPYRNIFVGHSNQETIRYHGASGGMATAISLQLLEEQMVDGVVVLDFNKHKPYFPEVKIACDKDTIIHAAQSKYFIYPQNIILKKIKKSPLQRIAFLGLPCQVHGIKKAIQKGVQGTEKIKHVLGIYCGNNLYFCATKSLMKRFGFDDLNTIRKIAYREGDYPGDFILKDTTGRKVRVDKITFNYLSFFFTPIRCFTCIDLTNEFADISFGDGWHGTYVQKNTQGRSIVIIRNDDMYRLIKKGIGNNRYELHEINSAEAIEMHANVLDNKKVGANARINIYKRLNNETPDYFLKHKKISLKRYIFETVNTILIFIFRKKFLIKISEKIPIIVYTFLMKHIRGLWREKSAKKYSKK